MSELFNYSKVVVNWWWCNSEKCFLQYLPVQKRLRTGHRRSALGARSCPKQSPLSVNQKRAKQISHSTFVSTVEWNRVPYVSLTGSHHKGVRVCFCAQVKINRSESQKARRGQAKSTQAAWEVLECRDCDIMFSRPDNSFLLSSFSHTQSMDKGCH